MPVPKHLYGDAPPPTGEVRRWFMAPDQAKEAIMLLSQIRQHQAWGHDDEVANLRQALMDLPGFPGGNPGDHYEIHVQAPVVAQVSRWAQGVN